MTKIEKYRGSAGLEGGVGEGELEVLTDSRKLVLEGLLERYAGIGVKPLLVELAAGWGMEPGKVIDRMGAELTQAGAEVVRLEMEGLGPENLLEAVAQAVGADLSQFGDLKQYYKPLRQNWPTIPSSIDQEALRKQMAGMAEALEITPEVLLNHLTQLMGESLKVRLTPHDLSVLGAKKLFRLLLPLLGKEVDTKTFPDWRQAFDVLVAWLEENVQPEPAVEWQDHGLTQEIIVGKLVQSAEKHGKPVVLMLAGGEKMEPDLIEWITTYFWRQWVQPGRGLIIQFPYQFARWAHPDVRRDWENNGHRIKLGLLTEVEVGQRLEAWRQRFGMTNDDRRAWTGFIWDATQGLPEAVSLGMSFIQANTIEGGLLPAQDRWDELRQQLVEHLWRELVITPFGDYFQDRGIHFLLLAAVARIVDVKFLANVDERAKMFSNEPEPDLEELHADRMSLARLGLLDGGKGLIRIDSDFSRVIERWLVGLLPMQTAAMHQAAIEWIDKLLEGPVDGRWYFVTELLYHQARQNAIWYNPGANAQFFQTMELVNLKFEGKNDLSWLGPGAELCGAASTEKNLGLLLRFYIDLYFNNMLPQFQQGVKYDRKKQRNIWQYDPKSLASPLDRKYFQESLRDAHNYIGIALESGVGLPSDPEMTDDEINLWARACLNNDFGEFPDPNPPVQVLKRVVELVIEEKLGDPGRGQERGFGRIQAIWFLRQYGRNRHG